MEYYTARKREWLRGTLLGTTMEHNGTTKDPVLEDQQV